MENLRDELKGLNQEKQEIENRLRTIEKRKHEIDIELTAEDKGDILKDRWFWCTGICSGNGDPILFYSKNSLDKVWAYDNRNNIERKNNMAWYTLGFKGYAIILSDKEGPCFKRVTNETFIVTGCPRYYKSMVEDINTYDGGIVYVVPNSQYNFNFIDENEGISKFFYDYLKRRISDGGLKQCFTFNKNLITFNTQQLIDDIKTLF